MNRIVKQLLKGGGVALAILLGVISIPCCAVSNETITDNDYNIEYRLPDVPEQTSFADETIDLTRYDLYERYERELTAACYMHSNTLLTIKRANRYLPVIVPILQRENIPVDFIYLAAIESSFNPLAYSSAKAAGIWQFMPTTAREYGLEVNSDVDERYNVEKATVAACKYLRNAYNKYGSWIDAAASYNAGTQRITSERNKQGVESALDMYLVQETSRYVFRILATKQMMSSPSDYGFKIRANQLYQPIKTRTVVVTTTIDDLAAWAKEQGITYKQLKDFNPWLRSRTLPNKSGKKYEILIPLAEDMYYNNKREYRTFDKNWIVED